MIYECEYHGQTLTDEEIWGTVNLLLGGGVDTTQSALSVAFTYMDLRPDIRQRLIEDVKLRKTAIEEFLRYNAPQQSLARTCTRDVEIGGEVVKAGQQILTPWAAGNWDNEVFHDPDQFIPDRSPNRHMTFGIGSHRCMGSNFARTMFSACLDVVLDQIPNYKVDHEGVKIAESVGIVYCYVTCPVTFEPQQI